MVHGAGAGGGAEQDMCGNLWMDGYSATDIVGTLFRVAKSLELPQHAKLEIIKVHTCLAVRPPPPAPTYTQSHTRHPARAHPVTPHRFLC